MRVEEERRFIKEVRLVKQTRIEEDMKLVEEEMGQFLKYIFNINLCCSVITTLDICCLFFAYS